MIKTYIKHHILDKFINTFFDGLFATFMPEEIPKLILGHTYKEITFSYRNGIIVICKYATVRFCDVNVYYVIDCEMSTATNGKGTMTEMPNATEYFQESQILSVIE